eukprot:g17302.t1
MIQHDLRDAGYRTGLIGKAHLEAYQAPPEQSQESMAGFEKGYGDWSGPYYGFDEVQLALGHVNYGMTGHYGAWLRERFSEEEMSAFKTLRPRTNQASFGGEGYDWDLPLEAHNSVWTGDRAVDFIEAHDDDKPFFLFASFQDPHHPHALPSGYENRVDVSALPDPLYVDGELEGRPPHFQLAREGKLSTSRFTGGTWEMSGQGAGADFRQVSAEAARDGRAQYYGMVGLIDDQLQRIWAALEGTGQLENTLIIVTSDHGELLGDHGLWMKGPFHYEQVIRVPLLMRVPKSLSTDLPADWDAPVSLVDLPPTCRQAAGLPVAPDLDGETLLAPRDDRSVLVETVQDWHALKCLSIVSKEHKLTCYPGESYGELTDLEKDPFERVNLFEADPELRARKLNELLAVHYTMARSDKERAAPFVSSSQTMCAGAAISMSVLIEGPLNWVSAAVARKAVAAMAAVVHGSLLAASRHLGLTQPTVGRHIDLLEEQLGFALFTRGREGVRLTEKGADLVGSAQEMLGSSVDFARVASGFEETAEGTVRVSANEIIGALLLPHLLADFMVEHPMIEVEIEVSNSATNLLQRDADIAIRMFRPTQNDLVARKIIDLPLGLYAAHSYLERPLFSFVVTATLRQFMQFGLV